nr:unnamed protein product [Callosobruchus analis]
MPELQEERSRQISMGARSGIFVSREDSVNGLELDEATTAGDTGLAVPLMEDKPESDLAATMFEECDLLLLGEVLGDLGGCSGIIDEDEAPAEAEPSGPRKTFDAVVEGTNVVLDILNESQIFVGAGEAGLERCLSLAAAGYRCIWNKRNNL